ncbi:RRQRL motif-containing zinc-binding protein, partial [Streptomyces sp. NRRL S-1896]|uniref:RRQRL motif-containing zinc-binding protein n=1 Tax=Streptomyces sp. NRRL S-1896 TaxID=1463893 RepID=UPI002D21E0F3
MADVYRWHLAPDGLATRRQLRALGLRPGGQDVVAELPRPRRRRAPLVAYLYR